MEKLTKQELINLLTSDVVKFNEYRKKTDYERIDLRYADLRYADLSNADLLDANLSYADLSNANLRYADLSNADLRYVNLRYADLSNADLRYANLSNPNLRNANLLDADLDFSVMPLWCGDLKAGYDEKQIIQQLYHVLSHVINSDNVSEKFKKQLLTKTNLKIANQFHRVDECGILDKN